jgi:putative hydrolase of the HAD superfamily
MPGVREALEQFHRLDLPVAVVSNTSFSERVIRYELGKQGLADHLAFVMMSAEYSVRKPKRLIFETAAAGLGIAPKDTWFVGDRLDTDVAGAKAAGMTAVWFHPQQLDDPSTQAVDVVVSHWDDLARLIQETSVRLDRAAQQTAAADERRVAATMDRTKW